MASPDQRGRTLAADDTALALRPRNIEDLTKVLAGLGIGCYILGLLVVNVYLFRIGVSEFALFRTRFILTGAAALIPLLASLTSSVLFRYVYSLGEPQAADWQSRAGAWLRWSLIGAPIAGLVLMVFVLSGGSGTSTEPFWTVAGLVMTWTVGVALVGLISGVISNRTLGQFTPPQPLLFTGFRRQSDPGAGDTPSGGPAVTEKLIQQQWASLRATSARQAFLSMLAVFQLALIFGLAAAYVYGFAYTLFPQLPEQFGGGRPNQVQLLFRQEAVDDAQALGLGLSSGGRLSRPLSILWDGETVYVIRPPAPATGPVIRLDKTLVSAVVVGTVPAMPTPSP
jgi:hypothetical protein